MDYGVKAGWICDPLPAIPAGSPSLVVGKNGGDALLSWSAIPGATGYDVVHGDLGCLGSTGDFAGCTQGCLDAGRTTTNMLHSGTPGMGDGHWFLVRGQNCAGAGTYGTVERDVEILDSGEDCP